MAKVDLIINGKDKATPAVKGVTKSIIAASLAVEGIKLATKALIDVTKQSIEALRVQEQAEAKLESQIGDNINAVKNWASEIQNATTVGDEQVLTLASLASSMGVTTENLEDATKGAIGLSEAFGIDLNTSMKMVALANEGQYTMLARYIPELRTAADDSEKMAIVQDAMANGFELATVKADTFTGKLSQLKNAQGDTLEAFGSLVAIVGKDYVDGMIQAQQATQTFLKDARTITAVTEIFNALTDILQPFKDLISDLADDLNETNNGFNLMEGILKTITSGFVILLKAIQLNFKLITDFITLIKDAGKAAVLFWQSITGDKSAREAAKASLDAMKLTVTDLGKSYINFGKEVADSMNKIWGDVEAGTNKSINSLGALQDSIVDTGDTFENTTEKMSNDDKFKKIESTVQNFGQGITSIMGSVTDTMKMYWDNYFNEQLSRQAEWQENQLAQTDQWVAAEMERQGVQEETKQEQLNRELAALQTSLNEARTSREQEAIQEQINEKQNAIARTKIIEEGEKKKALIQKKAKKEETALKKQQFQENKNLSIANIWINAASAVMGFWASLSSLGVAGIVLAAVMSAAALTMAGVQTGIVSGQSFHGQEGGEIPLGTATGDRAVTFMNKGEALLRNDDYKSLVGMARGENSNGGGFVNNGSITIVANNPEEFRMKLIETKRFELAR